MAERQRSMEGLVVIDKEFWRGKRVFVSGHSGFKGSWLSLWLQELGAEVYGYGFKPPTNPSLFDAANVSVGMTTSIGDVRDLKLLQKEILDFRPSIIFHLAAQPLVLESYSNPADTYSTNVMGTVNILEAARFCEDVRAIVCVTSDKCYENREWAWGYRENERMGGYDPYSNSKGCAELVCSAYRSSFFHTEATPHLATVRAGNVIGGGDWAKDRLIPDVLRAFSAKENPWIRNPRATRPWQHVLDPICGYLLLAQKLVIEGGEYASAWNFGPDDEGIATVEAVVERLGSKFDAGFAWNQDSSVSHHEATLLKLDISKARSHLGWEPVWKLNNALDAIISWHKSWLSGDDMRRVTIDQISLFENDAMRNKGK